MLHLCLRIYCGYLLVSQPSVFSMTVPTLSTQCWPTLPQSKTEALQAVLSDQVAALLGDKDPEEIIRVGRVLRELRSIPPFCRF